MTSPAGHSYWLLAEAAAERDFLAHVAALAARFGTEPFHPHLTLAGDLAGDADALAAALPAIAAGCDPFAEPVAAVEESPAFFRSFYARFAVTAGLSGLRTRAHAAAGIAETTPFMPHVSLAYGVAEPARRGALAEWRDRLVGMPVRFDRVALVASSDTVPIADWRILAVAALGG